MEEKNHDEEIKIGAEDIFETVDTLKGHDSIERKNIFRVKYQSIQNISDEILLGLSDLMGKYESVSLYECFKDCKEITKIEFPR